MSTKKSILFLLGVIIVSLVFMSSLFMSDDDPSSPDEVENDRESHMMNTNSISDGINQLNVAVSMTEAEFEMLEEQSRDFMSNHPVLVHLHNLPPDEVYKLYKTSSQLGEAHDVMLLDNVWVNEFAALGYLEPLKEELMLELEALQIDPMLSQVRWNGFLWAVPKEVDPYILAWNEKKFTDIDMEAIPPSSFEQLIAVNHLFTQLEEPEAGVYFDFHDPYAFISLVWSLGGEWIDPVEHNPAMLRQELAERLESFFYAEPKDEEEWPPSLLHELYPIPDAEWDPWEAMNNDEMAIMITAISDYMRNAVGSISISALPAYHDETNDIMHGGWLNGRSFAVSSKSEVKEEAFLWIKHMTSPETQLKFMDSGGGLPVFHTAYESALIQDKPYFNQIVDAIEEGSIFPVQPEMSDKILVLQEALVRLRLNELTIQEFLEELASHWQELSNY